MEWWNILKCYSMGTLLLWYFSSQGHRLQSPKQQAVIVVALIMLSLSPPLSTASTTSSVSATESLITSQLKCRRCDNLIWMVVATVFCTCLVLSNLNFWRNVNFQMSLPDGDVSPNTSCNKESLICLLTPLTFSSLREPDKKLAISSPFHFHLKSLPMLKAP